MHFFVGWLISWSDVSNITMDNVIFLSEDNVFYIAWIIDVMYNVVDEIGNILSIFLSEDNVFYIAWIIDVMYNVVDEIGNILSIFLSENNVVCIFAMHQYP